MNQLQSHARAASRRRREGIARLPEPPDASVPREDPRTSSARAAIPRPARGPFSDGRFLTGDEGPATRYVRASGRHGALGGTGFTRAAGAQHRARARPDHPDRARRGAQALGDGDATRHATAMSTCRCRASSAAMGSGRSAGSARPPHRPVQPLCGRRVTANRSPLPRTIPARGPSRTRKIENAITIIPYRRERSATLNEARKEVAKALQRPAERPRRSARSPCWR